jgi:hypothetical protein
MRERHLLHGASEYGQSAPAPGDNFGLAVPSPKNVMLTASFFFVAPCGMRAHSLAPPVPPSISSVLITSYSIAICPGAYVHTAL